eukprot:gene21050-27924_t
MASSDELTHLRNFLCLTMASKPLFMLLTPQPDAAIWMGFWRELRRREVEAKQMYVRLGLLWPSNREGLWLATLGAGQCDFRRPPSRAPLSILTDHRDGSHPSHLGQHRHHLRYLSLVPLCKNMAIGKLPVLVIYGFHFAAFDYQRGDFKDFKNGFMAACVLTIISIILFDILSVIVLFFHKFADMKLGYGIMMGSSINSAWLMLLAGLVLQSMAKAAENYKNSRIWSSGDYHSFIATFSFNYLLCVTHLVLFFVLWMAKSYFLEEGGGGSGLRMMSLDKASPAASAPAAPWTPASGGAWTPSAPGTQV